MSVFIDSSDARKPTRGIDLRRGQVATPFRSKLRGGLSGSPPDDASLPRAPAKGQPCPSNQRRNNASATQDGSSSDRHRSLPSDSQNPTRVVQPDSEAAKVDCADVRQKNPTPRTDPHLTGLTGVSAGLSTSSAVSSDKRRNQGPPETGKPKASEQLSPPQEEKEKTSQGSGKSGKLSAVRRPRPVTPVTHEDGERRKLSAKSNFTLETLLTLERQFEEIDSETTDISNNFRNKCVAAGKAGSDLAQLEARLDRLQCEGVDSVETISLTSGKEKAKALRKHLTQRAEKMHTDIDELFVKIRASTTTSRAVI